jgi:hypothetical protein
MRVDGSTYTTNVNNVRWQIAAVVTLPCFAHWSLGFIHVQGRLSSDFP